MLDKLNNLKMKDEYTFSSPLMGEPFRKDPPATVAYYHHRRKLLAGDRDAWDYEENHMRTRKVIGLTERHAIFEEIDKQLVGHAGAAKLCKREFDEYIKIAKLPITDAKVKVVLPDDIEPRLKWAVELELHHNHFIFKLRQLPEKSLK